jgi:hypothetical protein
MYSELKGSQDAAEALPAGDADGAAGDTVSPESGATRWAMLLRPSTFQHRSWIIY